MLARKQISSKKNSVLVSIMILSLVGMGYFVFRLYRPVSVSVSSPTVASPARNFKQLPVDFGKDLFSANDFRELRSFGEVPVKVRNIGKTDPFGLE